jgi:hypothetical protein
LAVLSANWGVCTWKPILLFHLVTLLHLGFDHFFQTASGQSYISTIRVHGAILEVPTIHKHVHEVIVKLQHPELGVLVEKKNWFPCTDTPVGSR